MNDYTIDWAFHCAYEIFYGEHMPEAIATLLTTKSDVLVAHVIADPVEYMACTIRRHATATMDKIRQSSTITVTLSTADLLKKMKEAAEEADRKGNTPLALLILEMVDALEG